eukprot:6130693-Alexandrium_andersonii.AAC.1
MPPAMVLLQEFGPGQVFNREGGRGLLQPGPRLAGHQVAPGSDPEDHRVFAIDINDRGPRWPLHHLFGRE